MNVLSTYLFAKLNYVYFFTELLHCNYFALPLNLPLLWRSSGNLLTSKLFTLAMAAAHSRAGKLMINGQLFPSSCSLHLWTQPSQFQKYVDNIFQSKTAYRSQSSLLHDCRKCSKPNSVTKRGFLTFLCCLNLSWNRLFIIFLFLHSAVKPYNIFVVS
jgi:hypothetical protein